MDPSLNSSRYPLANESLTRGDTAPGSENVGTYMRTLAFLVSLFTTVSNGSILVLLCKSNQLRQTTYVVLVLALCVTDLLVGMSGVLLWMMQYISSWTDSVALCFLQMYVFVNGIAVSLAQIFLICLNRYLVAQNSRYNDVIFDGKRKYVTVLLFWVIFYTYPLWGIKYVPDIIVTCSITTIFSDNHSTYLFPLSCSYVVLYILIIAFYIATTRKVRKRLVTVDVIGDNTAPSTVDQTVITTVMVKKRAQAIHMSWTIGIILLLLVLMTGPFISTVFLLAITNHVRRLWRVMVSSIALINSAINPIVYFWRIPELRHEIKKQCTCKV